jgi:hypothetical protein
MVPKMAISAMMKAKMLESAVDPAEDKLPLHEIELAVGALIEPEIDDHHKGDNRYQYQIEPAKRLLDKRQEDGADNKEQ